MPDYDVIVIGSGPGGYVCAIRAAQLGKKTAIIEKSHIGGVCVNIGCIPTKALLRNAEIAHIVREKASDFGILFDNLTLDYAAAVKRSRSVAERMSKSVSYLMKKNAVTVINGSAAFIDRHTLKITDSAGALTQITGEHIVIAAGAYSSTIPGVAVDGRAVLSYKEAILQTTLPESVIIIGAGAIGAEFSTLWSAYGTRVTLVEMLPRVLPLEDEEISLELQKHFQKRGIDILTGARVQSVATSDEGVTVEVSQGDTLQILRAQQVLVAIGFKPNTQELNLEGAGVETTSRGFIKIDKKMQTNVPGIWAVGDISGELLLAHAASAQGVICAEAISGMEVEMLDYTAIPRATYTSPQVASFGMTEAQLKEKAVAYQTGRFNFIANGKAIGLGEGHGFCKVMIDPDSKKVLGASLIGPEVSELLPELTLAHQAGIPAHQIAHSVHAHPTLSEVVMEAAHAATGTPIHG